jgi:hypothetical protein
MMNIKEENENRRMIAIYTVNLAGVLRFRSVPCGISEVPFEETAETSRKVF